MALRGMSLRCGPVYMSVTTVGRQRCLVMTLSENSVDSKNYDLDYSPINNFSWIQ